VGTVTKVEFDPGSPFANIIAKPVAQLDRIREVMLLENESPGKTGARRTDPPSALSGSHVRHDRRAPRRRLGHRLSAFWSAFLLGGVPLPSGLERFRPDWVAMVLDLLEHGAAASGRHRRRLAGGAAGGCGARRAVGPARAGVRGRSLFDLPDLSAHPGRSALATGVQRPDFSAARAGAGLLDQRGHRLSAARLVVSGAGRGRYGVLAPAVRGPARRAPVFPSELIAAGRL
jgi:hypothetical protein